LLGADKLEQAQVDEWLSFVNTSFRNASKKEVVSNVDVSFSFLRKKKKTFSVKTLLYRKN
jgi:hypothetical protein